jgi:hypothetical protein
MAPSSIDLDQFEHDPGLQQTLADALQITWDDLQRLYAVWRSDFIPNLQLIKAAPRWLRVQLLSGSFSEYRRATNNWWDPLEDYLPNIKQRPVYFISSNSHSISNALTGFGLRQEEILLNFIQRSENKALRHEWEAIQAGSVPSSRENFLYYALKKFQGTHEGHDFIQKQDEDEKTIGLHRILSEYSFDVEAQLIEISGLKPDWLDPRLPQGDYSFFRESDAVILNIDYPLGLSAYNILSKVAETVGKVLSVYVMGKAATLNGVVGDVMIPNVVHDEHSQNTYIFQNCFSAADVAPYLVYGTVLDNQKAVTVQGTFLQNAKYMDVFYREGYTDIEMESGGFLSAVYEMFRPKRHPMNEIVNLYGVSFDVGIIHYVSDTPLGKGRNLGAGSLSYFGMDSTYASTLAILHRILLMERARLGT